MVEFEYFMRYIMCFLVIAVIVNCVWSLVRLKPKKKVYAILQNATDDTTYSITCYETSIGRNKSCDISFKKNTTVSRTHAVIALRPDGFYVFDTESKMGVYLNGEKIDEKAKLQDGDTLAFGTEVLNFYVGNEAQNDISQNEEKQKQMPLLVNITDGTEFLVDGDFVNIGRQKGSNIELPAKYVSRKQAEIFKQNRKWYIKDFGSVTKTTVNGKPVVGDVILNDGDVIKIGDYAFLFEY